MPKKSRIFAFVTLGALGALVAFSIYVAVLFQQLRAVFNTPIEFTPTRIYSDLTRLTPPQARNFIESRLTTLGYRPTRLAQGLEFELHARSYPSILLPEGHPQAQYEARQTPHVELIFQSELPDAPLQEVRIEGASVDSLHLEPELIATLSKTGTDGVSVRDLEIREVLPFDQIPALVWKAIIAVEDQHFLEHRGLDPRGLARAIWINLRTFSLAQGGSTITQQLVKNLQARRTKNIFLKFNELFLALLLEAGFEKEAILERYLNEVYLGQIGRLEIHGVSEAAKHFFAKPIDELNLAEIALLAGLIRGPAYYSPYKHFDRAMERQRWVLSKMVETGQIAEEERKEAESLPIRLAPPQSATNKAPYFTDFVKAELIQKLKDRTGDLEISEMGYQVYTTLDPWAQMLAQRAVAEGVSALEKRFKLPNGQRLEGALASVDHKTGAILSLVGGRNYADSTFNRILNMKRQVGSTFKPFVYLAALRKVTDPSGVPYGPAYPVHDGPWKLTYDRGRQSWEPRNYEKGYLGWTNFQTALAQSVNTVAAQLGMQVGLDHIIETSRALGITSELPAVPSLSLGVAELSPVELLRAYATLANHGVRDELTVIWAITDLDGSLLARYVQQPTQRLEAGPIYILRDLLSRVFTEGTARSAASLGLDRPAAGKTGTTSRYRDAWFAGYTHRRTTVVWVGMDQDPGDAVKTPVHLTGGGSALPIWVRYQKESLAGLPPLELNSDTLEEEESLTTELVMDRHSGRRARPDCSPSQVVSGRYDRRAASTDAGCDVGYPTPILEATD